MLLVPIEIKTEFPASLESKMEAATQNKSKNDRVSTFIPTNRKQIDHRNRVVLKLLAQFLRIVQKSAAECSHTRNVRRTRRWMGDKHRKLRVFAEFHAFRAFLPNIDRAVDHAVIECQTAHNESTLLRHAFPDHILRKTDMIISYHQRSLLVNRHNVGMAVHRLVLARGLQNETVVPLVRLEIGAKSLLAGRRSVGIRAEAIMTIFNALVSYEDGGTVSLRFRQFGSDFLVELAIKSSDPKITSDPLAP